MARRYQALVLDTWAVLAYFEDEPAGLQVSELIAQAHEDEIPLYMSVVNAAEVWYILARAVSETEANSSIRELERLGIHLVDAHWRLARMAGEIKSKHKMSLADCFAAALAQDLKAHLLTGDQEFSPLSDKVKLIWLSERGL